MKLTKNGDQIIKTINIKSKITNRIAKLLVGYQGPTPWYVANTNPLVTWQGRKVAWRLHKSKLESQNGFTILYDVKSKKSLLALDFMCYVFPFQDNTMLIAFHQNYAFTFTIIEIDKLEKITNIFDALSASRKNATPICINTPKSPTRVKISTKSITGKHNIKLPQCFKNIQDEILIMFSEKRPVAKGQHSRPTLLASFNFSKSSMTITPQDWFNKQKLDFEYVWLPKAVRDPKNGEVIVEGIRYGVCVLDKSAKKINRWLLQFMFHMPPNTNT